MINKVINIKDKFNKRKDNIPIYSVKHIYPLIMIFILPTVLYSYLFNRVMLYYELVSLLILLIGYLYSIYIIKNKSYVIYLWLSVLWIYISIFLYYDFILVVSYTFNLPKFIEITLWILLPVFQYYYNFKPINKVYNIFIKYTSYISPFITIGVVVILLGNIPDVRYGTIFIISIIIICPILAVSFSKVVRHFYRMYIELKND